MSKTIFFCFALLCAQTAAFGQSTSSNPFGSFTPASILKIEMTWDDDTTKVFTDNVDSVHLGDLYTRSITPQDDPSAPDFVLSRTQKGTLHTDKQAAAAFQIKYTAKALCELSFSLYVLDTEDYVLFDIKPTNLHHRRPGEPVIFEGRNPGIAVGNDTEAKFFDKRKPVSIKIYVGR